MKIILIGAIVGIVSVIGLIACGRVPTPKLIIGGLYSIDEGKGGYRIAKILALDDKGTHIRFYKNSFATRPDQINPATLEIGTIHDTDGFGMGHLPLLKDNFQSWNPIFIKQTTIEKEELEGYEMWKEAGGGYFGSE